MTRPKPRTVRKLGPEFDALADSLPDLPHGLLAVSGQGLMTPKPGEPECFQCGAFLMFSARQRGDGLCGPCSRNMPEPTTPRPAAEGDE